MHTLERPVFLYDADCGICEQGTQRMRTRMRPPVDIIAWQDADLQSLGVAVDEVLFSPVFVRTDGTHVTGVRSMLSVMASTGAAGRRRAAVLGSRALLPLIEAAFRAFYRNRHRLPGGTDACRLPGVDHAH